MVFQDIMYEVKMVFFVIIAGLISFLIFHYFLKKWFSKIRSLLEGIDIPLELINLPMRFLFPAIILLIIMTFLTVPQNIREFLDHFLTIWFIIGIAWLIIRIFSIINSVIMGRYEIGAKDNLKARQVSTQMGVIQRVFSVIVIILATSIILITFEKVREIGVSILASAGIAGIIIGFAAQRSLATLIAGIQIAITQPIRIDDVVIVENEWGRIEEITLTYAVVCIWDQRRLIVPITYFLERPFQNWTRTTAELLGTIYIYTDYGVPVEKLRKELKKTVKASPLWDGRVANIQITNSTEKSLEIRALVSAENSSNAWELRCHVREKLIDFMQKNYPDKLPRIRLEENKT